MGPDLSASPRVTSCPSCGAAMRPDATWCSLCFHDLRRPEDPVVDVPPSVIDPLTAPLLDVALPPTPVPTVQPEPQAPAHPAAQQGDPGWPCLRCGARNVMGVAFCGDCGAAFLADAVERPTLVVPGIGDLHAMSRGRRLGLAAGALLVVLLPLALITYLLTGAPAKTTPEPRTTTVVAP